MAILPKLINTFNAIHIKTSADLFEEFDKLILQFTWKCKGHLIAKNNFAKKKSKVGKHILPNFKTNHKVTTIKTAWYLFRRIDIEVNEIPFKRQKYNPDIYSCFAQECQDNLMWK